MRYYYVKQGVRLSLPHKTKDILPVAPEALAADQLPFERIYCGYVPWEYIEAQKSIGKDNACMVKPEALESFLPLRIQGFSLAGDIVTQLQGVLASKGSAKPVRLRCALINGTGTMLGDTVIGASALEHVIRYLQSRGIELDIAVVAAWNARPGVEVLWQKVPGIQQVFDSSITLAQLRQYDFVWDFSDLMLLPGIESMHFGDFYFHYLGMDPGLIDAGVKLPTYRMSRTDFEKTRELLAKVSDGKPLVFFQAEASTFARSVPNDVFASALKELARDKDVKVVITSAFPKGLSNFERSLIINLSAWTQSSLDRYFAAISLCQYVISVDTLSMHIAMAGQKPGLGLFSISEPAIRLKYSPQIEGLLIPNAQELPYWNKHKHDDQWTKHQAAYLAAWEELRLEEVIQRRIEAFLNKPVESFVVSK